MKINELNNEERQKIILILQQSLPKSRLVQLGATALDVVLKYALASPVEDIIILRAPNGDVVGFSLISYAPASFARRLLCYGPFLGCFVANIWRLRWSISFNASSKPKIHANSPEAIIICIDAPYRGNGWGVRLLNNIESVLRQRNISDYFVKTEAERNERVIDFYLKANFKKIDVDPTSNNFFVYLGKKIN